MRRMPDTVIIYRGGVSESQEMLLMEPWIPLGDVQVSKILTFEDELREDSQENMVFHIFTFAYNYSRLFAYVNICLHWFTFVTCFYLKNRATACILLPQDTSKDTSILLDGCIVKQVHLHMQSYAPL